MSRAPGDIDPKALDAGARKRRHPKLRDRPPAPATLKAEEAKALAKLKRLPSSPGIMFEPRQDGEPGWVRTAPHDDWDLWDAQMHVAFGSRSRALVSAFLGNLKRLCRSEWDDGVHAWKPNEQDLNAAIAFIADVQPQNAVEASLAAQMFAIQLLQLRLSAQAFNSGGMAMEKDVALASKLARTYTMQLDQLHSMRGGKKPTRQTIKVKRESHHHQHIHVHRGGGSGENDAQPHEPRAAAIEGRATMSGSGQGNGAVVPFPCNEGQGGVSQARRDKRGSA
jgi:hypothetical protein